MKKKTPTKTNTHVRRDIHGLFVATDGDVFRPVITKYSYAIFQPAYMDALPKIDARVRAMSDVQKRKLTLNEHKAIRAQYCKEANIYDPYKPDPQLFREDEPVYARHVNQTPYAVVASLDGRRAYWWSHGHYTGSGSHLHTTDAWMPETDDDAR